MHENAEANQPGQPEPRPPARRGRPARLPENSTVSSPATVSSSGRPSEKRIARSEVSATVMSAISHASGRFNHGRAACPHHNKQQHHREPHQRVGAAMAAQKDQAQERMPAKLMVNGIKGMQHDDF